MDGVRFVGSGAKSCLDARRPVDQGVGQSPAPEMRAAAVEPSIWTLNNVEEKIIRSLVTRKSVA
ncbi:MAG TPA: hypothetical protein VN495_00715 [Candidatus Paceibacterota bacterium]|nr:hypothetical protein [Candidatus Paceibacterota bacterium]